MNVVRICSRGSALALAQAGWVKNEIEKHQADIKAEIVAVKTSGDRFVDNTATPRRFAPYMMPLCSSRSAGVSTLS